MAWARPSLSFAFICEVRQAILREDVATLDALLKKGADPNALCHKFCQPRTALVLAAQHHFVGGLKSLLSHGADVNCRDGDGKTALLHTFHPACMQALIEAGGDVNAQDFSGQTVLHAVISYADKYPLDFNPRWVQAVLEIGVDPRIVDKDGHTAFWHAERILDGEWKERVLEVLQGHGVTK